MSQYPAMLSTFLSKISNYTVNGMKMVPNKSDLITPSSIVVVDFPNNAQVSLDSLCEHALVTTTTTAGFASLPRHGLASLISRIAVEVNGVTIGTGNNMSDVYNLLYNLSMGTDAENKGRLYHGAGAKSAPTANEVSVPYKLQNFIGFLGSVQPRHFDIVLVNSLRLHISLESANVLIKSSGSANESYRIDDLYFTVDSMSISDGVYYLARQNFLNQGGILELPYDSYFTCLQNVSSFNQSTRFNVSSDCVDWVLACFPKNRTIQEVNTTTGQTGYFTYSAEDPANSANTLVDWSFGINNKQYPQYKPKKHEAFPLLLNLMGTATSQDGGICASISSQSAWNTGFWCAGIRTSLLTAPEDRIMSGLTTSGTNSVISFESSGAGSYNPTNVLMVVKCTSVLRIGANADVEVVP